MYLQAWLLVLFPLHFFFHFLYYTDVGSLTFVVASYLVSGIFMQTSSATPSSNLIISAAITQRLQRQAYSASKDE